MAFLDTLGKIGEVALDLGTKAAQAGLLKVKELGYQTQKSQYAQPQPASSSVPLAQPTFPNPPATPDWIEALRRAISTPDASPTYEPTSAPSAPAPSKPAGGPADQTSILLLLALGAVLLLGRR